MNDEIQSIIKKELRSIKKNIDKDNDITDLRKILIQLYELQNDARY